MSRTIAARATLWSAVDLGSRQAVQFIVTLVLARLLTPEIFGVFVVMMFFVNLAAVTVQTGLVTALIQRQDSSREEESALFWFGLLASAVVGALLVALGPALARFYSEPALQSLMWVAAAQLVVLSLASIQSALLTRQLRFRTLALVGMVANAISGAAAIVAALNGAGVWALAINILLSAAVSSALLWVVHDWRPRLVFGLRPIAHYLSFGGLVSIGNILEVIYSGGFSLLIGKFHGLRDVGLYNRASSTQGLPSGIISALIGRVALPLFAARQGDPEAHKRGLRSANEFTMLLNLPAMAGLALLSDLVIEVLFGPQWSEAAPILSILAVGGILLPLHSNNVFALLGRGNSKLFIKNNLLKISFGAVAVISATPFGITAVAYAQLIYSVVALAINTAPSRRELAYGAWSQLHDLRGLLLTTLAMSIAVATMKLIMSGPALLVLGACVIAGAASYVAAGFLFGVAAFRNAHEVFRQLLNRSGEVEMSDTMLASEPPKTIL